MKLYRLKQTSYNKLNDIAYKYGITPYDLEDDDVWNAIDTLRQMYLQEEENKFIEEIANLITELPTPYYYY